MHHRGVIVRAGTHVRQLRCSAQPAAPAGWQRAGHPAPQTPRSAAAAPVGADTFSRRPPPWRTWGPAHRPRGSSPGPPLCTLRPPPCRWAQTATGSAPPCWGLERTRLCLPVHWCRPAARPRSAVGTLRRASPAAARVGSGRSAAGGRAGGRLLSAMVASEAASTIAFGFKQGLTSDCR